jgi:hypothetical protein
MKRFIAGIISAFGIASSHATPPAPPTQDYSHITTRDAAEKLAAKGELFKILLFPQEFGGEDVAANVVYVPAGIPEIKDRLTDTLIRYYEDGVIDNLTVTPEYKGNSFIPSKILFRATHSSKEGIFEPSIDIW